MRLQTLLVGVVLVMVVLATVNGPTAAAEISVVEVEGVGAIVGGDAARARDEALRDAYRRALESAGVQVTSLTEVRSFQLFYDYVLTRAEGYIRRWDILSERSDGGLYRVRIRAEVARGSIRGDTGALELLVEMMGNPAVMVLIDAGRWHPFTDVFENELAGALADAGYHTVDARQLEQIRRAEVIRYLYVSGDRETAIALGVRTGADLLLVGRLDIQDLGGVPISGVWLRSVSAVASYKLIGAATGQTLLASSAQAAAPDLTWDSAGVAAARKLGRAVGDKLVWEIPRRFGPIFSQGRTVQLIVIGADYDTLTRLVAVLKAIRGVDGRVYLRSFDGQVAVIDLKTNQLIETLLTGLLAERSLSITVVAASATRAEIRVTP